MQFYCPLKSLFFLLVAIELRMHHQKELKIKVFERNISLYDTLLNFCQSTVMEEDEHGGIKSRHDDALELSSISRSFAQLLKIVS